MLPIGPKVVPFWGSYLEFYKGIPKRNYFGAYGYNGHERPLQTGCAWCITSEHNRNEKPCLEGLLGKVGWFKLHMKTVAKLEKAPCICLGARMKLCKGLPIFGSCKTEL